MPDLTVRKLTDDTVFQAATDFDAKIDGEAFNEWLSDVRTIAHQKQMEADFAEYGKIIAALAVSAGGEVTVTDRQLREIHIDNMITTHDYDAGTVTFAVI